MERVTFCYSAGLVFAFASLVYLTSCQSATQVEPIGTVQMDSTKTYPHIMDDGPNDPPKKPGGPGCCQQGT